MSDLLKRLREGPSPTSKTYTSELVALCKEAADEIELLQDELQAWRDEFGESATAP